VTAAHEAGRVAYEVLDAARYAEIVDELGALLADAVDSGASVNFVRPFSVGDGIAWWRSRHGDVAGGAIRPIVARVDGRVVGVVLLVLSRNPNSPHRAEVQKVIVERRARGRGIGSGLMRAVEELALTDGRWLLVLDTQSGTDAERLYRRLGWQEFGVVPNHSLRADGHVLLPTTFFWKDLRGDGAA
jgi:GNAT superfamily N-acetyltransferase